MPVETVVPPEKLLAPESVVTPLPVLFTNTASAPPLTPSPIEPPITVPPLLVLESVSVCVLFTNAVPLTLPPTVSTLPDPFLQVWLAANTTGTFTFSEPDDGATDIPIPAGLPV